MFLYLVGTIVLLCLIHICFNYNERARLIRKIPGPKEDFIIGNVLRIIQTPVGLMQLARKYTSTWNGIFRLWAYPLGAVLIYNVEDAEIVMSSMKHSEKGLIYKILKPWLAEGLLLSNGAKWQERRKVLTPSFHFNILRQFLEIINENAQRLVNTLNQDTGKPIDLTPIMSEFTLNSVCETAMGTKLTENHSKETRVYKNAIHELGKCFVYRIMRPYLFVDFLYNLTSNARYQNRFLKIVHNFTKNVIKERRKHIHQNGFNVPEELKDEDDTVFISKKKSKTAMLDLLLRAEAEGFIDNAGIQEEVDTFMFEGHDTTGSGLVFMYMLLANHKNVQDKILAEINDVLGDTKRKVKMEDLNKMKYLDCCVKESLRLYPPVHFISRTITEDTTLSNYTVPAGTICLILIYDLHRQENLFPEPHKFNPDRFLPENSIGRHPYSYVPFSAGPRNCIGQKFALMEMKIAVAEVLREFELSPVTRPEDIQLVANIVLRNNGPVTVQFNRRQ